MKIDKFIFLVYFVILDCKIDVKVPIMFVRSFLDTQKDHVHVESGELKFRLNSEEVTFNIFKSIKQTSYLHIISVIDVIDEEVASVSEVSCVGKSLVIILNYDGKESQDYDKVVCYLSGLGSYSRIRLKLYDDLKNRESPPINPSIEEPPKLEYKVFHLTFVMCSWEPIILYP